MGKRTPLYENHLAHGGKIVEFGGFELPVEYEATRLTAEHMAVRTKCGLFDVSHMGEFEIKGPAATETIQLLMANDISDMYDGQVRYTMMLNENGGIVDAEAPFYACKAQLYCSKCKAATRASYKVEGDKKTRVCAKCGAEL